MLQPRSAFNFHEPLRDPRLLQCRDDPRAAGRFALTHFFGSASQYAANNVRGTSSPRRGVALHRDFRRTSINNIRRGGRHRRERRLPVALRRNDDSTPKEPTSPVTNASTARSSDGRREMALGRRASVADARAEIADAAALGGGTVAPRPNAFANSAASDRSTAPSPLRSPFDATAPLGVPMYD